MSFSQLLDDGSGRMSRVVYLPLINSVVFRERLSHCVLRDTLGLGLFLSNLSMSLDDLLLCDWRELLIGRSPFELRSIVFLDILNKILERV